MSVFKGLKKFLKESATTVGQILGMAFDNEFTKAFKKGAGLEKDENYYAKQSAQNIAKMASQIEEMTKAIQEIERKL